MDADHNVVKAGRGDQGLGYRGSKGRKIGDNCNNVNNFLKD